MSGYRPAYTVDEDMFILKMIIELEAYYMVRSKLFWEDVSNSNLIDRTWQSLKERFDKHILPRINDSRYTISDIEKKNIQLACYQLSCNYSDEESEDFDESSGSSTS